jgi:hypothetical protein
MSLSVSAVMRSGGLARPLALLFAGVLAFYFLSFLLIEHLRVRKGPWQVTFGVDPEGVPAIQVLQPVLGISNVTLLFPDQGPFQFDPPQTIQFDGPSKTNLPFGQVVFLDPTFLPGTVTLDLFGHEIELIPRALVVDKKEIPWQGALDLQLRKD